MAKRRGRTASFLFCQGGRCWFNPTRPNRFDVPMSATDNFTSLHRQEEELRARSLAAIGDDPARADHWRLVAEAMNLIYAFTHDHAHGSENELTLQYLGVRLFNAA